jgi:hypothetical protein
MQGRKEIQAKMMYQVNLDDLVVSDNFYRKFGGALDLSFLYKETLLSNSNSLLSVEQQLEKTRVDIIIFNIHFILKLPVTSKSE